VCGISFMSETLEMSLSTLNEWLKEETPSIIEPLVADARRILEDTKSKLEELSDACNKLLDDAEKEMAKSNRKTYRRAKFLYKLAGTFSDLIEKVTIPEQINGRTLNETSEQLEKTIKTIGQEKIKWFRAISPYFIISRRRFEASFKRTDDSIRNFTDFMVQDYTKAETAEKVFSKIEDLNKSLAKLEEYEKGKQTREQKKEFLEMDIITSQQKLQAIQSKGEVVELVQINSQIKELTENVKYELRHIQKPLLKFQTLVNSPGYSLFSEAISKLDEYLTNPFDALATEKEDYPLLRSILQKIDTVLDTKQMKLKQSRLRKAKDQINYILNKEALASLQNESKRLLNKKNELTASGIISTYREQRAKLHEHLKDLHRRKSIIEARDNRLEKEYNEILKRIDEQKQSLETIVADISQKTIQIVIK